MLFRSRKLEIPFGVAAGGGDLLGEGAHRFAPIEEDAPVTVGTDGSARARAALDAAAQAALAATYTLGYRIGLIVGGAGALYLAEFQGWTNAYLWMAALMLVPVLTTLIAREPAVPEATVVRRIDFIGAFWQPFTSFFSSNGLLLGLALLVDPRAPSSTASRRACGRTRWAGPTGAAPGM